jgi:hypothetical protein
MEPELREHLASIIDNSADAIVTSDLNGKVLYWNKGAEELYGYSAEEVIGRSILDFYPEELKKERQELGKILLEKGAIRNKRTRIYNRQGKLVDIILSLSLLRDEKGNPLATIGISKDISREVELERTYRDLVENALDGINIVDREGNFVLVNQEYCRMLGYSRRELIGKSFLITLPPGDREEGMRLFRKSIDEQVKPYIFEGRNMRKDGNIIDVQIKWNYVYRDDRVDGTMAIVRDITERKKLERALKEHAEQLAGEVEERTHELVESEERYRNLFESTQDAVYRSNEHSVFVSMNQAGAEMFGFSSPSEIIGRSVPDFWVYPEDRKVFLRELEEKGSVKEYLIHAKNRDGDEMYLEASAHILRDEEGNFKGVEGILRNITERLSLERALKDYSELLEETVKERTRELVQSNRLKDLFTDIMRHDLLNPVGLIRNYAELLIEDEEDEVKKEDLRAIIATSEKLVSMIENASKYGMLSGIDALKFKELDLNEIFQGVVKQFEHSIKEKKIKLDYLTKGSRKARVHSTIEDVFANLLDNAIKYSPAKSTITIDIRDTGEHCLITVADQGAGVPDEYKELIFERFERGGKQGVKGTGLGLAIVKRVVELHKGRVGVKDNPRGGSIFYVELPKGSE